MKSRQVFIALMVGKGYTEFDLEWDGWHVVKGAVRIRRRK